MVEKALALVPTDGGRALKQVLQREDVIAAPMWRVEEWAAQAAATSCTALKRILRTPFSRWPPEVYKEGFSSWRTLLCSSISEPTAQCLRLVLQFCQQAVNWGVEADPGDVAALEDALESALMIATMLDDAALTTAGSPSHDVHIGVLLDAARTLQSCHHTPRFARAVVVHLLAATNDGDHYLAVLQRLLRSGAVHASALQDSSIDECTKAMKVCTIATLLHHLPEAQSCIEDIMKLSLARTMCYSTTAVEEVLCVWACDGSQAVSRWIDAVTCEGLGRRWRGAVLRPLAQRARWSSAASRRVPWIQSVCTFWPVHPL